MKFIICGYGEASEEQYVPIVESFADGIELQNYDRTAVLSPEHWSRVVEQHERIRRIVKGTVAVHGPYAGIDYECRDWIISEAVRRRMDMTFDMARRLRPDTLVLHSGLSHTADRFSLADAWLDAAAAFWQREIGRYADIGVQVVLENVIERTPDTMTALADRVGSEYLGLCLDVGHAHLRSKMPLPEWVCRMQGRLRHVHLHDNSAAADDHLPVGQGTIDFDSFFDALYRHVPGATVSIEVLAEPPVVMDNARTVIQRYKRASADPG